MMLESSDEFLIFYRKLIFVLAESPFTNEVSKGTLPEIIPQSPALKNNLILKIKNRRDSAETRILPPEFIFIKLNRVIM